MTRNHSALRTLLLCISVGLTAQAHAGESDQAAYTQAKQRWQAAAIRDYAFSLEHLCFCRPEYPGAIRITVRNQTVQSATWVVNGQPVSAEALKELPTLDRIFQQIDEGYAYPAEEIRLTLNPAYGYPEKVYIDYSKMIADEELIYTITDFAR